METINNTRTGVIFILRQLMYVIANLSSSNRTSVTSCICLALGHLYTLYPTPCWKSIQTLCNRRRECIYGHRPWIPTLKLVTVSTRLSKIGIWQLLLLRKASCIHFRVLNWLFTPIVFWLRYFTTCICPLNQLRRTSYLILQLPRHKPLSAPHVAQSDWLDSVPIVVYK